MSISPTINIKFPDLSRGLPSAERLAVTVGFEFVVQHVNGKLATIYRDGYSAHLLVLQARRSFAKHHEIHSIDIFRVSNIGEKDRVICIHKGNQARDPKPVAAIVAAVKARPFNVSKRKVGGLTFIRIGRLSLSYCFTKKAI